LSSIEEIKQDAIKRGVVVDKAEGFYMEKRAKRFVVAQSKANKQAEKRAAESGGTFTPTPVKYPSFG